MKSISSALIVLSGSLLLIGSDLFPQNSDMGKFVAGLGTCILLAGMAAWFVTLKRKE